MKFDLQRFIDAQDLGNSYETALAEIRNGLKESHWIWYVFPQLRGLGVSYMSTKYGIDGIDEARAYLTNDILHDRLCEITSAAIISIINGNITLEQMLGQIDAQKFRSSMTLFRFASTTQEDKNLFQDAISMACADAVCTETVRMLTISEAAKNK